MISPLLGSRITEITIAHKHKKGVRADTWSGLTCHPGPQMGKTSHAQSGAVRRQVCRQKIGKVVLGTLEKGSHMVTLSTLQGEGLSCVATPSTLEIARVKSSCNAFSLTQPPRCVAYPQPAPVHALPPITHLRGLLRACPRHQLVCLETPTDSLPPPLAGATYLSLLSTTAAVYPVWEEAVAG